MRLTDLFQKYDTDYNRFINLLDELSGIIRFDKGLMLDQIFAIKKNENMEPGNKDTFIAMLTYDQIRDLIKILLNDGEKLLSFDYNFQNDHIILNLNTVIKDEYGNPRAFFARYIIFDRNIYHMGRLIDKDVQGNYRRYMSKLFGDPYLKAMGLNVTGTNNKKEN